VLTPNVMNDTSDGQAAAWADYDNDGDQDLYVVNGSGQSNKLFANRAGGGNNWLRLRILDASGSRTMIGARVEVVTAAGRQIREVGLGSGYLSQNPLVATFGVGAAASATVTITWPCGKQREITYTTSYPYNRLNQENTVREPAGTHDVVAASMQAWSTSNPDPSFMTLNFNFEITPPLYDLGFEVQYRRGHADAWNSYTCYPGYSPICPIDPFRRTYKQIRSYSPCEYQKFQWRARVFNYGDNGFGSGCWSSVKTFVAYCITQS
jgi:hypothetical protein